MLEERVAELESALLELQANSVSGPPPIPPRGLLPSPKRVVPTDAAMPHMQFQANNPQPPNHPPALPPPLNQTPSRLLPRIPYSRRTPNHPPPLASPSQSSHTPQPPQHPAPQLPPHPASRLPQHPPSQSSHTPQPPQHPAPRLPPHPAPQLPQHPPQLLQRPPQLPPHPSSQLPPLQSASSSRGRKDSTVGGKLPSSVINKSPLLPVTTVIQNNADLVGKDGQMRTMALALAREAFFGEEVMVRCTAQGYGETPGLPHKELMELKEELRKLYPIYWNNPLAFEQQWSKSLSSISQACKRLRSAQKSKNKRL